MSNEIKIMRSVAHVIDFIKSEVLNNLIAAKQRGHINTEQDEIRKIASVVSSGIQSSFSKSMNEIVSVSKTL